MVDQKIRKMMIQVSQSQQRRDERKDDRRWQNITLSGSVRTDGNSRFRYSGFRWRTCRMFCGDRGSKKREKSSTGRERGNQEKRSGRNRIWPLGVSLYQSVFSGDTGRNCQCLCGWAGSLQQRYRTLYWVQRRVWPYAGSGKFRWQDPWYGRWV